MATVAFVDGATGNSLTDVVSVAKADITGLSDGDFVIVWFGAFANRTQGWSLSGWTQVGPLGTTSGFDVTSAYIYKFITDVASEPTTWDFLVDPSGDLPQGAVAGAFRNVDGASYLDATTATLDGLNDLTPDAPDITTVKDGAMIVTMHSHADVTQPTGGGAPSGFALTGFDLGWTGSQAGGAAMAHLSKATAGLETIGSWTHTVDNAIAEWHVRTISLSPAAPICDADTDKRRASYPQFRPMILSPCPDGDLTPRVDRRMLASLYPFPPGAGQVWQHPALRQPLIRM